MSFAKVMPLPQPTFGEREEGFDGFSIDLTAGLIEWAGEAVRLLQDYLSSPGLSESKRSLADHALRYARHMANGSSYLLDESRRSGREWISGREWMITRDAVRDAYFHQRDQATLRSSGAA